MSYWLWKDKGALITVSPPCNYEDIKDAHPDAVPVKPRFVRRGDKVSMPAGFAKDFKFVMDHYGESARDIDEVWKPYVREYPEHALRCITATADAIRRSVESQLTEKIRHNIKQRRVVESSGG